MHLVRGVWIEIALGLDDQWIKISLHPARVHEEFYNPTLIYIEDGKAVFKQIEVKKPEREKT